MQVQKKLGLSCPLVENKVDDFARKASITGKRGGYFENPEEFR